MELNNSKIKIKTKNLNVYYGVKQALFDINLDINQKEVTALIGPSGCGKSTLLKIASGLLEPTAGDVAVDRDSLGYVFQDATLLPWRTVLGNVELLCELHGMGKAERRELAEASIDLVGLQVNGSGLAGVITGRALYEKCLDLRELIAITEDPEHVELEHD